MGAGTFPRTMLTAGTHPSPARRLTQQLASIQGMIAKFAGAAMKARAAIAGPWVSREPSCHRGGPPHPLLPHQLTRCRRGAPMRPTHCCADFDLEGKKIFIVSLMSAHLMVKLCNASRLQLCTSAASLARTAPAAQRVASFHRPPLVHPALQRHAQDQLEKLAEKLQIIMTRIQARQRAWPAIQPMHADPWAHPAQAGADEASRKRRTTPACRRDVLQVKFHADSPVLPNAACRRPAGQ